jgi:hypothetical protein
MAIVIEEQEQSGGGVFGILTGGVALVVILAALYYAFLKSPALVVLPAPSNFDNIQGLSQIELDPNDVVRLGSFQALKLYITLTTPSSTGRANPLLGF